MQESVIDFPKAGLCPEIWEKVVDDTGLGDMWKMRQEVKDKLIAIVQELQTAQLLPINGLVIHVTGSITSNQYTENADIDLHFHSDSLQLNSNEEVDKLNKDLRASYKQEFIGKHPIEIYYQDNKFQDYMSVGCYDVANDIWEVGPEIADSSFNPYAEYYDEAKKQSEAMASQIRNKILSVYETAIVLKKNLGTEFGKNLRGVLLEQLASVQALYDSIRKTRKVYSSPTSKEEALQFRTSRKWHIADTTFKLFDKYGYLAILKQFIEDFKLMSETNTVDEEIVNDLITTVKKYIGNADKLMDSEFYEAEVNESYEKSSGTPQYDRVYNEINKLISQTDDQKFGARDKLNRGNKCILLWHGDVKKDKYGFDNYSGCDKSWDPNKSCGLVEVQTFPNHEDLTKAQADEAIEKARSFISKHSVKQVDEGAKEAISAGLLAALLAVPGILPAKTVQKSVNNNQKYEMIVKDLNQNAKMFGNYTALQSSNIIARTLYAEARNDGKVGMEAVASVIYNRAKGNKDNFTKACLKPKQFSCWNKFTKEEADPKNFKIKIPNSVNKNKKNEALWKEAMQIVADMLNGTFKPTTTANMYFNPQKCSPKWANELTDVKMIGSHKFGILKNHSPFI